MVGCGRTIRSAWPQSRQSACSDVVVFDGSAPLETLDFSRREARRVNLSAVFAMDSAEEVAVASLLKQCQASGAHVVYLKTAI
jgi:siroheme synthase